MDEENRQPQSSPQRDESEDLEAHRSFVREMNSAFGTVYGYGGAAVLLVVAGLLVVGWRLGQLTSPLLWLGTVVIFLASLFVLRMIVRRRAERLLERIRQYCEVNDLTVQQLREHFEREDTYPYFDSIFEIVERRRQITSD